MKPDIFKVKLLNDAALPPYKVHEGDAGFDVYSNFNDVVLGQNEWFKCPLGFAMEISPGWVALINEKSGMATKNGLFTIGNVIDSSYRGECHAIIACIGPEPVVIKHGQKVAQMLVMPCYTGCHFDLVTSLSNTNRGDNGFGSTGL